MFLKQLVITISRNEILVHNKLTIRRDHQQQVPDEVKNNSVSKVELNLGLPAYALR